MRKRSTHLPDEAAYAGRWVARVQGDIVGQGGTPEAAQRAAQANRPKEKPVISYVHGSWSPLLSPILAKVTALAQDQDVYLVGGAVRDALLGIVSHDFDVVVPRDAIKLARLVARALDASFYVLDETFDAARVIVTSPSGVRDFLDFASFRGESVTADLEGRDFTINAVALDLKRQTTLDPLQGAQDLRSKILRACRSTAMEEDPIRVLRGVRLAAALELRIEPTTRLAMKAAASSITMTSAERQRDELFRILGGPRPDASLRALEMLGVLAYLLPEVARLKGVEQPEPHVHDAWEHTLGAMNYLGEIMDLLQAGKLEGVNGMLASLLSLGIGRFRPHFAAHFDQGLNRDRTLRALLQFATLYHDVGKPLTRSVDAGGRIHFIGHEHQGAKIAVDAGHRIGLSTAEIARAAGVVENHLRFFFLASRNEDAGELPSRRAIYRFFRDTDESAVDVILLGLADLRATRGHTLTEKSWSAWVEVARVLLSNLWETPAESVSPPRLIDGKQLMTTLSLQPGPLVGELLAAIREAQATGEVGTPEEALEYARRVMAGKTT